MKSNFILIFSVLALLAIHWPIQTYAQKSNNSCQDITIEADLKHSCTDSNNGHIYLNVSGGKPPYSYSWSDGHNKKNRANLASGHYSITVKDAENCIVTQPFTLQPINPVNATLNINNVTSRGSNDGSIKVNIENGAPPYKLLWLGKNGILNQHDTGITEYKNLSPDNYHIIISDKNGCSANLEAVVK